MKKMSTIIKKAGKLLKMRYFQETGFTEKERYHLLSETDIEIYNFLKNQLQKHFPSFTIYSEEDPDHFNEQGDNHAPGTEPGGNKKQRDMEKQRPGTELNIRKRRIIIDPIDGTTNFIAGKPYFTISIAVEEDTKITKAFVFNPVSEELYYADATSNTSYYNGRIITSPGVKTIEESIVVVGLSYNPEKFEEYKKNWGTLFKRCRKCLCWVTPAQTICNVARGKIDLFLDSGCSTHGQSAGSLLLRNAGGKLFNYDTSPYDHRIKGGIFVSGSLDHTEILKYFAV